MDGQVIEEQLRATAWTHDDALEIAIREHGRFLYRIAYSVLRNHHDAEDALQEAYVRALRHGDKLQDVRNCRHWLARIVWRIALDRKRKCSAAPTDELGDAVEHLRANLAGTEEAYFGTEMMKLLDVLIAALPRKLRDPLVLAAGDELTPHDIADILGVKEVAVRSRLFRARRMLREKLNKLMEVKHGS